MWRRLILFLNTFSQKSYTPASTHNPMARTGHMFPPRYKESWEMKSRVGQPCPRISPALRKVNIHSVSLSDILKEEASFWSLSIAIEIVKLAYTR